MPLYDFRCTRCGHEFEALSRPQDPPVACPSCQSGDLEKLLSGFATSTAESRAANALSSRKRQINANKDKLVADEEYPRSTRGTKTESEDLRILGSKDLLTRKRAGARFRGRPRSSDKS